MNSKGTEFVRKEILSLERNVFFGKTVANIIAYVLITLWLNSIRATAALWFVWVLIVIQLLLYFLIFSRSYQRAKVCGFKTFAFPLFLILCVLGRVNDWEILVIPAMVIMMLIFSSKTKNIPDNMKHIINEKP
jgi:hypothetical protein